jgi:hypothetical protein
MEKETLSFLVIEQYKFHLLSEHIKINGDDLYYQEIKLNEPAILKNIFAIIGFPFFGKELSTHYIYLFEYLENDYYDNIYFSDPNNYSELKQKSISYIDWLYVQKKLFDEGKLVLAEEY